MRRPRQLPRDPRDRTPLPRREKWGAGIGPRRGRRAGGGTTEEEIFPEEIQRTGKRCWEVSGNFFFFYFFLFFYFIIIFFYNKRKPSQELAASFSVYVRTRFDRPWTIPSKNPSIFHGSATLGKGKRWGVPPSFGDRRGSAPRRSYFGAEKNRISAAVSPGTGSPTPFQRGHSRGREGNGGDPPLPLPVAAARGLLPRGDGAMRRDPPFSMAGLPRGTACRMGMALGKGMALSPVV